MQNDRKDRRRHYEELSSTNMGLFEELRRMHNGQEYLGWEYSNLKDKFRSCVLKTLACGNAQTRMLDIGCADGRDLEFFSLSRKFTAFGIDLTYFNLSKTSARQFNNNKAFFIQGFADRLPFRSESFDIAICSEVIEHLPEQRLFIKEVSRVLKEGGKFFITTPNRLSYFTLTSRLFPVWLRKLIGRVIRGVPLRHKGYEHLNQDRHLHEFTPGELMGLLRQEGFAVSELKGGMLAVPFPLLFHKIKILKKLWDLLDAFAEVLPLSAYLKAGFMIACVKREGGE